MLFFYYLEQKCPYFFFNIFLSTFKESSYWARDIIFLVTEHEQLGMQAWLEAYHHTTNIGYTIDSGQLDSRAGAIQVRPRTLK